MKKRDQGIRSIFNEKIFNLKLFTNSSCPEGDAYIIWLNIQTDPGTLNELQGKGFVIDLVKSIFTKFALLLQYFLNYYLLKDQKLKVPKNTQTHLDDDKLHYIYDNTSLYKEKPPLETECETACLVDTHKDEVHKNRYIYIII